MRTALTLWGTHGTIYADRQECRVYLRGPHVPQGYQTGWNVRYTTDLTPPVDFYVRGEEYSAQLHHFVTAALATRFGRAIGTERSEAHTSELQSRGHLGCRLLP